MLEAIALIMVMFMAMGLGAILMYLWDHRNTKNEESDNDLAIIKFDRATLSEIMKMVEDDDKEDEAE